jgi:nitroimidazol reductase NimA-like FMN-containing flavoprotein (pyridoxamine 5'-phosphate oxidase superfamily)
MSPKDPEPTQRLAPDECWELLGQTTVGRLAVIVDHHPDVFPVNYVLDRGTIVFRTGAGTKFWGAIHDPCALEIDGYEPASRTAWSVVVRGQVQLILDPAEKAAADSLNLDPWQPGDKIHYMRMSLDAVTGRRFTTTRPDIWKTPSTDPRTTMFH